MAIGFFVVTEETSQWVAPVYIEDIPRRKQLRWTHKPNPNSEIL